MIERFTDELDRTAHVRETTTTTLTTTRFALVGSVLTIGLGATGAAELPTPAAAGADRPS